jgi:hypothetical protein
MGVKVSVGFLDHLLSFDNGAKKLQAKLCKFESNLYATLIKATRDINEFSSIILELDDFKIELNLNDFDGQF